MLRCAIYIVEIRKVMEYLSLGLGNAFWFHEWFQELPQYAGKRFLDFQWWLPQAWAQ